METLQALKTRIVLQLSPALRPKKAQGLVEYGLVIILVGVAVALALGAVGTSVKDMLDLVENRIPDVGP